MTWVQKTLPIPIVKYWNGVGRKNGMEERKNGRAERWNGRKTKRTE